MRTKLLNKRLRDLRVALGLSQEAMGSHGFISTPGWVKIENATRHPSDALLYKLCDWLEKEGRVDATQKQSLFGRIAELEIHEPSLPFCMPPRLGLLQNAGDRECSPLAGESVRSGEVRITSELRPLAFGKDFDQRQR